MFKVGNKDDMSENAAKQRCLVYLSNDMVTDRIAEMLDNVRQKLTEQLKRVNYFPCSYCLFTCDMSQDIKHCLDSELEVELQCLNSAHKMDKAGTQIVQAVIIPTLGSATLMLWTQRTSSN